MLLVSLSHILHFLYYNDDLVVEFNPSELKYDKSKKYTGHIATMACFFRNWVANRTQSGLLRSSQWGSSSAFPLYWSISCQYQTPSLLPYTQSQRSLWTLAEAPSDSDWSVCHFFHNSMILSSCRDVMRDWRADRDSNIWLIFDVATQSLVISGFEFAAL